MRTLASSLLTAQKAPARVPYVRIAAVNKLAGVVRLKWVRLYTGSEDDRPHAVTLPGDGSLVRVRIGPSSGNSELYRQRVVNPGPGSGFGNWTATGYYFNRAVTVASLGAEVCIFAVNSDKELGCLGSTDYGATWGGWQSLTYFTYPWIGGLSAAHKPNGDIAVFCANDIYLYVKKRVGGNWQNEAAWDKTTGELISVATVYDGDWNLLVTGQDVDGNFKLWSLVYGDGGAVPAGTWSDLKELASAPAGGDYEYAAVFMDKQDVYRASYVEKFNGTQAYSRPFWSHTVPESSFLSGLWREPVPFDLTTGSGSAMAHHGDYAWLSTPGGVWRAPLAEQSLDLTPDVVAARLETHPVGGRLTVELRNDAGQYSTPGAGGLSVLDIGCQLECSPGYVTAQGNEVSAGPAFWLEAFEHRSAGGIASLALHGIDGWGLLAAWRARHQFRWNKDAGQMSVKQIIEFALARVGLKLEVRSESSTVTGFYPDFAIHPGDSGAALLERLLSFVPDMLFMEGATAWLVNPLAPDASAYSYGQAHAIFSAQYKSSAWDVNQVRVEGYDADDGTPVVYCAVAWAQVECFPERWLPVADRNLSTAAGVQARADAIFRKAEIGAVGGFVHVPVNCGQQLYDVIDITDSRAGILASKRRVIGMVLSYRPARAEYGQQLTLGGV